ncbi:helix-turn-helix domain-containing protein [uncultured Jatrophihabitans sp.]|uniref:helix-turn-helix domain-containing protein n=1 Tax=uncultured Jatrophihabitans sp. TaxID=1610747 RepID=UPI0035CAA3B8
MHAQPVLFTVREAAAALGIDPRTVHRWVNSGRLTPAKRVGGGYVFAGSEVARAASAPRPRCGPRHARSGWC